MNTTVLGHSSQSPPDAHKESPQIGPWMSDYVLSLLVPIVTHWLTSAVYEVFEHFQIFQQYRIHTKEEEQTRNAVGRWKCFRRVICIQIMQTALGIALGALAGDDDPPDEDKDLQKWILRVNGPQKEVIRTISSPGFQSWAISLVLTSSSLDSMSSTLADAQRSVERNVAVALYYFVVPAIRFYVALWLADTWVYFIHRAEHSNAWLYKTFHARHHELYIPYSWAGIHDQPVESMFLSVGAFIIAVWGTGMSLKESMFFSAFSSIKACTDHSGYQIPWNPVDLLTSIGAEYHDKHHQRWGFKKNFALHFQFWDRLLGTDWKDDEGAKRLYERDRKTAELVHASEDTIKGLKQA